MMWALGRMRGLSPRVRGNRDVEQHRRAAAGSIPACAGEPILPMPLLDQPKVYPRVCGGTHTTDAPPGPTEGLSPRLRGNPYYRCPSWTNRRSIPASAGEPILPSTLRFLQRSIPACAGEPSKTPVHMGSPSVYPRVCGGTTMHQAQSLARTGLSPRVRGDHSQGRHSA